MEVFPSLTTRKNSFSFRPVYAFVFCSMFLPLAHSFQIGIHQHSTRHLASQIRFASSHLGSTAAPSGPADGAAMQDDVPLYRCEGLLAVEKPSEWTSQDVVSYIRVALERDAKSRGAKTARVGSRRNKSRIVRVGHGGTLDPLATGVLVIGVGKGTKELQKYLNGSKRYLAGVELGYETTTLDMEGNVTKTGPTDHVSVEDVKAALPQFVGNISQIVR